MGTRFYPSSTYTEISLPPNKSPSQRAHAGQPYKRSICKQSTQIYAPTITNDNVQLFKRMLDQFDRLRKRNAFLEQYKKEKLFENGLEEFDESRSVSKCPHLDSV